MADPINTPGVPNPEDSARAQREATRAFPDDNNISPPRCYDQCLTPDALPDDNIGKGDVN